MSASGPTLKVGSSTGKVCLTRRALSKNRCAVCYGVARAKRGAGSGSPVRPWTKQVDARRLAAGADKDRDGTRTTVRRHRAGDTGEEAPVAGDRDPGGG